MEPLEEKSPDSPQKINPELPGCTFLGDLSLSETPLSEDISSLDDFLRAHAPSTPEADKTENDQPSSESDLAKQEEEDEQYPSGWRLTLITIGLCLCVFCMSLVRQFLECNSCEQY